MAFPDTLTNAVDGVTDATAAQLNALEAKIGVNSSAVTTSHDYKLSGVTGSAKAVSTDSVETIAGAKSFSDGVKSDTIDEVTAAAGVTVDGVLLKDSQVTTDTINEKTAATGVTVDGVLLKDSQVTTDVINEKTAATGVTVDGVLLKDGLVATAAIMTTPWSAFTPGISWTNGPTSTTTVARYCVIGKVCFFQLTHLGTANGSNSTTLSFNLPISASSNMEIASRFSGLTASCYLATDMGTSIAALPVFMGKYATQDAMYATWAAAKPAGIIVNGFYEID